ncbi:radical SAM/SPASM domain-containing protein [Bacteroides sp. 224]|uniref:radical SAM/SPASM domain-containing protein n=1 Tax=Bacteroides sp. 224 TaxID=2302936 RepID=UPI0013D4A465|nr:radical SAM protein [Bacteroides sp. 224]
MSQSYLKHAIIELTTECNLQCKHCYNWWKQEEQSSQKQNSYKKAFCLLDFLIKHTTVKHITFTGGEPTISERFIELVLHAKINGKSVTVITNGNGSPQIYKQLASMKVNMLEFSIHSSRPDIHDGITQKPGSCEKAIKEMKDALSQGISVTPVVVITATNHQYVEETILYFFRQGIKSVMVNRYNLGGEGLNNPNLSATAQQLRDTFGKLNTLAKYYDIRIFSGVCTPHCILNPDDYPLIRFGACSGQVEQRPLTFDLDGNLRLCNHSPIIAGNIYKESFEEIFASSYIKEWSDLSIPFCQGCTHLARCKGGCRAASEQVGHSLKQEDPIIRELGGTPFL